MKQARIPGDEVVFPTDLTQHELPPAGELVVRQMTPEERAKYPPVHPTRTELKADLAAGFYAEDIAEKWSTNTSRVWALVNWWGLTGARRRPAAPPPGKPAVETSAEGKGRDEVLDKLRQTKEEARAKLPRGVLAREIQDSSIVKIGSKHGVSQWMVVQLLKEYGLENPRALKQGDSAPAPPPAQAPAPFVGEPISYGDPVKTTGGSARDDGRVRPSVPSMAVRGLYGADKLVRVLASVLVLVHEASGEFIVSIEVREKASVDHG